MAKFENEGYCPCTPVSMSKYTDVRIAGLWSLIGPSIVYETKDDPDTPACDQIFSTDVIAYDVLSAIVRKNVNADKIKVRQLHNGGCNVQKTSDIQKVLGEVVNPQLIVHAGSDFVVILADAEYGLDVYVWDLRNTL